MFEQFSFLIILLIGVLALVTSTIHGATGVAGGFLLTAAIAPIIGVEPIVPVISVALLISHGARALFNLKDIDWPALWAISVPAVPCIIGMAFLYGKMSSPMIATVLGLVILASVPLRRWAKSRQITATKGTLSGVGMIYGGLSGVAIGPGMLLVPFMLGYGLSRHAFVATLAVIALITNIARVGVYGSGDLLNMEYLTLGLLIGIVTIPGNWLGRSMLRGMTNEHHTSVVDVLAVVGALNFFWLALR